MAKPIPMRPLSDCLEYTCSWSRQSYSESGIFKLSDSLEYSNGGGRGFQDTYYATDFIARCSKFPCPSTLRAIGFSYFGKFYVWLLRYADDMGYSKWTFHPKFDNHRIIAKSGFMDSPEEVVRWIKVWLAF